MSNTRSVLLAVIAVYAVVCTAWLAMAAADWLRDRRYRKLVVHTGRHIARPGEPPPLPAGEDARQWPSWWRRVTSGDGDSQPEGGHENVPGSRAQAAEGSGSNLPGGHGPGYFHDDTPTVVVPAVRLDDGSYAGLKGTIPADLPRPGEARTTATVGSRSCGSEAGTGPGQPDDTAACITPYPRSGPPAWHPAREPLQPWIQAILGAPSVDAWAWGWQQRRALAA
jgi:hypothetical protein